MIRAAIRRVGIYYYILPNAVQARRVMFDGITSDGERIIDYIPNQLVDNINIQQMKVVFKNGSIIQFVGSDRFDSLRGTNPVGVVLSEMAYQHPQVYPTLRPILAGNDGWFIGISTPQGHNFYYDLYKVAERDKDNWFRMFLTVDDTKHISRAEIDREIESGEISMDMAEQEYSCSFSLGAIGAYYAKYLTTMETNHQIGPVDWEPNYPVHTAWDLGIRDQTCILFFQILERRIHIIDMYKKSDVGLEHYIHYLQSLPYTYGKHIAPHDIEVREFTSGGITRKQKAAQLGIRFIVAPKVSIMDGIEAVRTTLSRIYIDNKKCVPLLAALRNYRKEYNTATKTYKDKPLHDHHSDVCDSLRYMCLSLPKIQTTSDPEALERRYQEAMYGNDQSNMPNIFRNDVPRY